MDGQQQSVSTPRDVQPFVQTRMSLCGHDAWLVRAVDPVVLHWDLALAPPS